MERQLDLSQKSAEQTRQRYAKGTTDFLRFLTTLLNHQTLQRNYLRAQRELVQYRISLYRALSGSWEMQRSNLKVSSRGRTATGAEAGRGADTVYLEGDSVNVIK